MKTKITIILIALSLSCNAQKFFQKNDWVVYGSQIISGACTGVREQVLYHPTQLFQEFPKLNHQWWDSRISCQNKYHQASYLVAFSDANHFFKAASLMSDCISLGFSFGEVPKKGKFWFVAKKILLSYCANKIGFTGTYYLLFKNKL